MHRPARKLWLPPQAAAALGTGSAQEDVAKEPRTGQTTGDADTDLDALTRQYEAEAAAAKAKAVGGARRLVSEQRGMEERRADALATPLASDTRGFQMLAAMGYQPGKGLGKSAEGRATPLDVNLKAGRTGLGVDEAKRRRAVAAQQERQEREAKRHRGHEDMRSSFLHGRAASFAQRRAAEQLAKARAVCETLDRRAGLQESHMWEPPPPPEGEEAAGDADGDSKPQAGAAWEELPAEQRLGEVLEHLRRRHAYCLFCGCQYRDEDDLAEACPGKWDDDH